MESCHLACGQPSDRGRLTEEEEEEEEEGNVRKLTKSSRETLTECMYFPFTAVPSPV